MHSSSTSTPTHNLRRFWFQNHITNRIQCIWAVSRTEAIQLASKRYLQEWRHISWLD